MTTVQVCTVLYMGVTALFFLALLEKDPKKATADDRYICAALSIIWPLTITLFACLVTYLIANKLPPFDDLGKKEKKP